MKPGVSERKLRGSYYTPAEIARFLAMWAVRGPDTRVLEPSCGDGSILREVVDVLKLRGSTSDRVGQLIHGVEIDGTEASKASQLIVGNGVPLNGQIRTGDFFDYALERLQIGEQFDAVVGNPPFIRYQNFAEDQRQRAFRLMRLAGLSPSRLTNAWVPFLVVSTMLLKEHGGRLAMVIPAELLQVGYAAELRRYLADSYSRITLFTFRKLVFDSIQQEVVLLLGEKNGNERTGIRTVEIDSAGDLCPYTSFSEIPDDLKEMDHTREKWTQYFLDQSQISLLRKLRHDPAVQRVGDFMEVDVGVVTGQNSFFVLTRDQVDQNGIQEFVSKIVARSAQVTRLTFTEDDFTVASESGQACFLLTAPNLPQDELPASVANMVKRGEEEGIHLGYKCRVRPRWYVVPSVWSADGFMLRQIHGYPKIAVNRTNATSTDTVHRVRFKSTTVCPEQLAGAFINSLSFAASEVMGRSYGGGVLELEPTEAEALLLPIANVNSVDLARTSELLISGRIDEALDVNDEIILRQGLGLDNSEIELLRTSWTTLRNRRHHRKH